MKRRLLSAMSLALLVACCKSSPKSDGAPAPSASSAAASVSAAPPPEPPRIQATLTVLPSSGGGLTNAIPAALKALKDSGDPVLAGAKEAAYQEVPSEDKAVTVLMVAPKGGDAAAKSLLPDVCEARTAESLRGVTLCSETWGCKEVPPSRAPVILCNGHTWGKLGTLVILMHDPALLKKHMASDYDFMLLAKRMETDPSGVLASAKDLDDFHYFKHMLMLATFILGHELHHIKAGASAAKFSDTPKLEVLPPSLASEKVCRNYRELQSFGFDLPVGDVALLLQTMQSLSPDEKAIAGATQKLMQEELDADAHAAEMVKRTIARFVDANLASLDDMLGEYTFNTLANAAQYLWYRALARVLLPLCADIKEKDFLVTRCMCRDRSAYAAVEQVFSETHPPMYLRISKVLKHILTGLDDKRLKPQTRALLSVRSVMMADLMDTIVKLSAGSCLLKSAKALEKTKQLYFTYTGLEGFYGDGPMNFAFPGAPLPKEEEALKRACFPDGNIEDTLKSLKSK